MRIVIKNVFFEANRTLSKLIFFLIQNQNFTNLFKGSGFVVEREAQREKMSRRVDRDPTN